MAAVWYRTDSVGPRYENSEPFLRLYRVARAHMVEIKVARSNITRGWTYNADIYLVQPTGKFYDDDPHIERCRFVAHGAGHGVNPLLALIDAVRLSRISGPDVAVAILEAEVWLLSLAVQQSRERAIVAAIELLRDTLRMVNISEPEPAKPLPAEPHEDDDL